MKKGTGREGGREIIKELMSRDGNKSNNAH
jgi:hypothetical protein